MKLWTMPAYYMGETWPGYYVFLGQNRDSDALTRSNFQSGLQALGGEDGDLVRVVREGHWACGWVEWIAVHQDATDKVKLAEEMEKGLEAYPVLDEDHWSQLEDEECETVWTQCFDADERLRYFREHSYTARSLTSLLAAIRGGSWHDASNMLHSPSDLLH